MRAFPEIRGDSPERTVQPGVGLGNFILANN
jgi:hypothetical protein